MVYQQPAADNAIVKLTNLGSIVGCSEDKLRGTIIARADVGDIGLVRNEYLRASKIAKLEDTGIWVEQKILRLDISMADALRMYVSEGPEKLVDVDLDLEDWHCSLHFVEKA